MKDNECAKTLDLASLGSLHCTCCGIKGKTWVWTSSAEVEGEGWWREGLKSKTVWKTWLSNLVERYKSLLP